MPRTVAVSNRPLCGGHFKAMNDRVWPASCLPLAPPLVETLTEAQIVSSASVAFIDNIILLLLA
jgi:hypothetical protein